MKKIAERTKKYGVVIFFFVFTVCLYGPFNIFLQNAEEFWFSLPMFAMVVIPFSLIVLVLLLLLSWFLPETKRHIIVKLFFGIALAMYIQGNYINISYGTGVLDGTEIIWSEYTTYAILDTLAWAVCIAAPFIIDLVVKKDNKKFFGILTAVSLFLTVIQIPAFVSDIVSFRPAENKDFIISEENMFETGESDNILIFILDTMDEEYYQTFISTHPEYTEQLEGFVHYDNAASAGCRTIIGLPAMFTGTPFTRGELYSEYLHRVWSEPNAFSVLNDAGYKVSVYSETLLFSSDTTEYIDNFHDGRGEVSSYPAFIGKIYKMDLYRFAPHLLKKYFWYYTGDFDEIRDQKEYRPYKLDDIKFYSVFEENGFRTGSTVKKAVQVYHLSGAHSPFKMDEQGKRNKDATRETQVAGSFAGISKMLQDLKEKGVYDDATIIITADHGDKKAGEYSMFLLKRAGSNEAYSTSSAPVSHFDLPVYLASLAGKELSNEYGKSYDDVGENEERERHMFYNTSGNSKLRVDEYVTKGAAGDYDSWKVAKKYEDTESASGKYTLGTTLSFTTEATGNQYAVEGFGNNTGFRTKMFGPISTLKIPIDNLPESGNLSVVMTFKALEYKYSVSANGIPVLESADEFSEPVKEIAFEIPVSSFAEDHILTIDIRFPDISEEEMSLSVKKRTPTGGLTTVLIKSK